MEWVKREKPLGIYKYIPGPLFSLPLKKVVEGNKPLWELSCKYCRKCPVCLDHYNVFEAWGDTALLRDETFHTMPKKTKDIFSVTSAFSVCHDVIVCIYNLNININQHTKISKIRVFDG